MKLSNIISTLKRVFVNWTAVRYISGLLFGILMSIIIGEAAYTLWGFCIVLALALIWSFCVPWPDYKE